MTDEDRALALGRIEASVKSLHDRFERHDRVHHHLQEKVECLIDTVAKWKGARAFGYSAMGVILGLTGWLVFLWGTGVFAR